MSLIGLGCAKNQVDSENLLGAVAAAEFVLCPDPADADVVVVNTCGFIQSARDECTEILKQLIRLKRHRGSRLARIALVGCWVEYEKRNLNDRRPDVDLRVGLLTPERISALMSWIRDETHVETHDGPSHVIPGCEGSRPRIGLQHVAYLRICDGCVNNCSYCTIPAIRGPLRSKLVEDVIREAELFCSQGVSELILVGQDLANFGRDRTDKSELPELVKILDRDVPIPWIRLMYLHPAHIDERLLEALADADHVVHYLDIPLQHISDRILRVMNRRVTRAEIETLISALRAMWPDLVVRTTFIVGFPGETEEDFAELEDFVRTMRFEHLGCFQYCREQGTPAAKLTGAVPAGTAAERYDRLMQLQQQIVFRRNKGLVGRTLAAIIDSPDSEPGEYLGRTYGDAPEVDGTILLTSPTQELSCGQIVDATVTGSDGYDLIGRV